MEQSVTHQRGLWNMACWNGLSLEQQTRLLEHGNLEWGYEPQGECLRPAEVELTTGWDVAPGPRFYCVGCAAEYLQFLDLAHSADAST